MTTPDGRAKASQRWIFDLERSEELSVDEVTKSITTVPLNAQAVANHRELGRCGGSGEMQRVLTYDTVLEVQETKQAKRVLREEKWRAPALNCFPLKEVLWLGQSADDLRTVRVSEATQVTIGEPPSSLFERPSGFTERSPSARTAELKRLYPEIPCPDCVSHGDEEADRSYFRRQGDRGK